MLFNNQSRQKITSRVSVRRYLIYLTLRVDLQRQKYVQKEALFLKMNNCKVSTQESRRSSITSTNQTILCSLNIPGRFRSVSYVKCISIYLSYIIEIYFRITKMTYPPYYIQYLDRNISPSRW